jgi:hypothetical protein
LYLLLVHTIFVAHHVLIPENICIPLKRVIGHISLFSCLFLFSGLSLAREQSISPIQLNDSKSITARASLLYEVMGLRKKGLGREAFEFAYKGYQILLEKNVINSSDYLVICDFSQSVKKKRFYIIDVDGAEIVMNTYVAHGRNSGGEYARRFSNKASSLQSSLGFYITKNTYYGEHGLSLKLEGLEPGFNDRAERRAIVMHGASYIGRGATGRSYGCPAVPAKESMAIINKIKNGSCLFIYHPQRNYLQGSKILNG